MARKNKKEGVKKAILMKKFIDSYPTILVKYNTIIFKKALQ